jgi:hypothetical protein
MGSYQCCGSGSGSLLVRSGSLKELWKFAVDFQPQGQIGIRGVAKSAGSKNLIYIYGCHTQRAVAIKRPILYGKKGFAKLSFGLF